MLCDRSAPFYSQGPIQGGGPGFVEPASSASSGSGQAPASTQAVRGHQQGWVTCTSVPGRSAFMSRVGRLSPSPGPDTGRTTWEGGGSSLIRSFRGSCPWSTGPMVATKGWGEIHHSQTCPSSCFLRPDPPPHAAIRGHCPREPITAQEPHLCTLLPWGPSLPEASLWGPSWPRSSALSASRIVH